MENNAVLRTSVAIIGAGPCGVTLANYLGLHGINALLIDRSPDILDYPRAVGMDDESLRSFQGLGLAEKMLEDMKIDVPLRFFTAKGRCFAELRPATREFGWPRRATFMQPPAEKKLRDNLARFSSVNTMLGYELIELAQDGDGVTCKLRGPDEQTVTLHADYLIGADGGRSTVRQAAGIKLLGNTSPVRWVVVDTCNDPLADQFSALYCDPRRPHVCIPLPHGYRRWEFMIFPDEDEDQMTRPESIRALIGAHAGNATIDIVRIRPYAHHSRIAASFQNGRIFLGGDAAHLMPPWAGQGMNSGIRDATNLAWKLAAVVQGRAHARILDTYDAERRHHSAQMIQLSNAIGAIFSPTNRVLAFLRDAFFLLVGRIPSIRNYVLQMRFKPMPRYIKGLVLHPERIEKNSPVGRMFIQPQVEDHNSQRQLLDEFLGTGFALLALGCDPADTLNPESAAFFRKLNTRIVCIHPRSAEPGKPGTAGSTQRLYDCDGQLEAWFTSRATGVVLLRPDRYVAAVCQPQELNDIASRFEQLFVNTPSSSHEPQA